MEIKIIPVVCAIIAQDDMVLCALRSEQMSLPSKWEFPGGKLELNEIPEDALIREIKEELNVSINVLESLPISDYSYVPEKVIRLIPFRCVIQNNEIPVAAEHAELRWVKKEDLLNLNWAEADVPIVKNYIHTK
jgi:8-oxo-dGTP diphosphatase